VATQARSWLEWFYVRTKSSCRALARPAHPLRVLCEKGGRVTQSVTMRGYKGKTAVIPGLGGVALFVPNNCADVTSDIRFCSLQ
jgi:hypothetical protein